MISWFGEVYALILQALEQIIHRQRHHGCAVLQNWHVWHDGVETTMSNPHNSQDLSFDSYKSRERTFEFLVAVGFGACACEC